MIQEIIVCIIGIAALGYILWRIFGKKKEDPCATCPKGKECAKVRKEECTKE
jgi:hypothetical protein